MAWIAMIGGMLLSLVGSFVLRVLISLGLAVVSYEGFSIVLDYFKNLIHSSFSGLGADVVSLLGYMQVGRAISIVFAAYLARLMVKGLASGVYKRWVLH